MQTRGPVLLVRAEGRTLVLGADLMAPGVPDLLDTGLGLWLLLLGALALARASDRRAGRAFWTTCVTGGLALGMAAAAAHGLRPALIAQFAALRLAGPAFLTLAMALPADAAPLGGAYKGRGRALAWIWLPALAVLPTYLLSAWRPDAFAPSVRALVDIVLLGYIVAACARIAVLALRHRALSAAGRAQLALLALGSVGGFAPFLALSLGPRLVTGAEIVPSQVTIVALALLPLCVSVAVVRTEFLGITALLHRRTLRLLVGLALLGLVAGTAWALAGAEALAADLVVRLRAVVADLYPTPLEFVGLAPALETLLRHAERADGLSCVLDIDPALRAGGAGSLTPAQEEALYEVVAQAVGNTLRHAAAETIRVSLWRAGAGLRLRVVDDGRGFAPRPSAALIEEGHIGLALLREHARALGGRLEVTTAPGRGTAIEVWAPDAGRAAEGAAGGAWARCDNEE